MDAVKVEGERISCDYLTRPCGIWDERMSMPIDLKELSEERRGLFISNTSIE